MSAPPPMLLPEELLAKAERMLFTKPANSIEHIVDLTRRNAFTDFMRLNTLARNFFIAQFVHMKEIVFEQRKPITLFKDRGKAWERSDRFYGPYLVTKEFVRTLLDSGVLLLSSLSVVGSVFSNEADINAQPSFARSPIQSFCKLFLNEDLSDEDAPKMHFALETLNIRCANDLFVDKFSEFLSLNANEVVISLYEMNFFDIKLPTCSIIRADRTEKISLQFDCLFYPSAGAVVTACNWEQFVQALLISCPKVKRIEFKIAFDGYTIQQEDSYAEFMRHFTWMADEFYARIFPMLTEGDLATQILLTLELECVSEVYEKLSLRSYEHFKRGTKITLGDELSLEHYRAREYNVFDKKGRQHKCVIRVLGRSYLYTHRVNAPEADDDD
uniref:F-box domain-containing protein n=1 Tax=Globodera rostochiensis TaxID=31243 RepID=A0A914HBB3_GLORO